MTTPVFPAIGTSKLLGWSTTIEPRFMTNEIVKVSGRSVRRQQYEQAIYGIELTYQVLRSAPAYDELQTMLGFYNQMQGQLTPFFIEPPGLADIAGQELGVGDGTQTEFVFIATYGASIYVEPVAGLESVATVYLNGTPVSPSDYTVSSTWPYTLIFAIAPTIGAVVTADYTQYWLVRFSDDTQDFNQFMKMLYELKTLKLETVRQYVAETTTGLHWVDRGLGGEVLALAMGDNGDDLVAAGGADDFLGFVYVSADQGATWARQLNAPGPFPEGQISTSDNALSLITGASQATTDGGSTWKLTPAAYAPSYPTLTGLAVSGDGVTFVAASDDVIVGGLYLSVDGGATWVPKIIGGIGTHDFVAACCSTDGSVIYAVDSATSSDGTGKVYVSTDGGASWATTFPTFCGQFSAVCCSDDGSYATVATGGVDDDIVTTTNTAASWSVQPNPPFGINDIVSLACNAAGDDVIMSVYNRHVLKSTDHGATWTPISYPVGCAANYASCASCGSGDDLLVMIPAGGVYKSTDAGVTWSDLSLNDFLLLWSANNTVCAIGASGSIMAIGIYNTDLFLSVDGGATWTDTGIGDTPSFPALAMSQDGATIATAGFGTAWSSIDSGSTWTDITTGTGLAGLFMSAVNVPIAGLIVIGDGSGNVWTTTTNGASWTNIASGAGFASSEVLDVCADTTANYVYVVIQNADLWGTSNGGTSWTDMVAANPDASWTAICCSSNGQKVYACQYQGDIWGSANYGATWTNLTTGGGVSGYAWTDIACDPSGANIVASTDGNNILTSSNSGATWTQRNCMGPWKWRQVAASDNLQKIYAATYDDRIWATADGGTTWGDVAPVTTFGTIPTRDANSHLWTGVACSDDGINVYAGAFGGFLFKSSNSGSTWGSNGIAVPAKATWNAVALSSDGTTIAASAGGNAIGVEPFVGYTADGGATWTQFLVAANIGAQSMAISGDGSAILLGNSNSSYGAHGHLIATFNNGSTWAELTGAGVHVWQAVAISHNGATLAATFNDGSGGIMLSTDSGSTWANVAPATGAWGAIALDWTGSVIYASLAGALYKSTNGGSTWVIVPTAGGYNVKGTDTNSDGTYVAVAADVDDFLSLSPDATATFIEQSATYPFGGSFPANVQVAANGAAYAMLQYPDDVLWTSGTP